MMAVFRLPAVVRDDGSLSLIAAKVDSDALVDRFTSNLLRIEDTVESLAIPTASSTIAVLRLPAVVREEGNLSLTAASVESLASPTASSMIAVLKLPAVVNEDGSLSLTAARVDSLALVLRATSSLPSMDERVDSLALVLKATSRFGGFGSDTTTTCG